MRCSSTPVEGSGDSEAIGELQGELDRAVAGAIQKAACMHDVHKLDYLLKGLDAKKAKSLINRPNRAGQTALYLAYRARSVYWHPVSDQALETMEYLLSKGADPNQTYRLGYNLDSVFETNKSPTVRALGLVEEPSIGTPGFSLLRDAAHDGSLRAVQLLVKHGADVNEGADRGASPLTSALFWDFRLSSAEAAASVIDYLLQRGAQLPPDYRLDESGRKMANDIIHRVNQRAEAHPSDPETTRARDRVVALLEPLLRRSAAT